MAAIDLGSNSFHMIVARLREGELVVIDKLREMVRLAEGLDDQRNLDRAVADRALACLSRFGQRLKDLSPEHVRIVGTNTLRSARESAAFLEEANGVLGHPIEIISGVEEARLIYLGVSHSMPSDAKRRLVMDIGGGSTELIIGESFEPLHLESLYMGCVSMSRGWFADGRITAQRILNAEVTAMMELEPHVSRFRQLGWEEAVGASGSIKSIAKVVQGEGLSDDGITLKALDKLIDMTLEAGHIDELELSGLAPERLPVFMGGLTILRATFRTLGIKRMYPSSGALREGLLYDMQGRSSHEDVRERTVQNLMQRFGADVEQAARVDLLSEQLLDNVAAAWKLKNSSYRQLLSWAAHLHEIGLDLAHNQYHKHGAYILEHADMPGFSHQNQLQLSVLVRAHRRKIPSTLFKPFPTKRANKLTRLAILLRVSVLLHRSRGDQKLPEIGVKTGDENTLILTFPEGWLERHPLTSADLKQECSYLKQVGATLRFE
ncbi:exopolyphosphatase [Solemya pervernicosa gill symbiont]|uniref:Exopolyphosphatase n=3 Tax=Gammaproteobacteria incertae sedis TaxID=118884 RepID=A0A1T2L3R0_9GAMM|nr:exopolyphosphatase [Solemya pervernicosa gill symbiont]QKQ28100.1 exopolyphosphatase [Candidatus Reidiella endopervernicosa]